MRGFEIGIVGGMKFDFLPQMNTGKHRWTWCLCLLFGLGLVGCDVPLRSAPDDHVFDGRLGAHSEVLELAQGQPLRAHQHTVELQAGARYQLEVTGEDFEPMLLAAPLSNAGDIREGVDGVLTITPAVTEDWGVVVLGKDAEASGAYALTVVPTP